MNFILFLHCLNEEKLIGKSKFTIIGLPKLLLNKSNHEYLFLMIKEFRLL